MVLKPTAFGSVLRATQIKLACEAIEGFDFFACLSATHDDGVIAQFVVVKSVERVAEFEHDVIGDVDDVVDAGYATGFEPVFQPGGRRLDFYAADGSRGETSAELRRANFNFDGVSGFSRGFCQFWRD